MKHYTLILNWKMYLSYNHVINWLSDHTAALIELTKENVLIICPSAESLSIANRALKNTPIQLSAQNCSEYESGAHTGQLSVISLQDMAINYCLVGHSEVRTAFHETNDQLLKKLKLLTHYGIRPIFCIGETSQAYEQQKTYQMLGHQLEPLLTIATKHAISCFIAYEPVWAIGTGKVATREHIEKVIIWIKNQCSNTKSHIRLFYGGSINANTIASVQEISLIDGFLIGKASTNFQELKKVVSLIS